MPDPRTIELIQLGLDDAIEPGERDELETRLATDSEARKLKDELETLSAILADTPVVEPPAGLLSDVMTQVRSASANVPAPFVDRRADRERKRTLAMRFGLGIAAAFAIGFVLVPSLRQTIDPKHAGGTMIGQTDGAETGTEIPIRGSSFSGLIRMTADGERVTLAIKLDSPADRQIRVRFDPGVVTPGALAGGTTASTDSGDEGIRSFDVSGAETWLDFARRSGQASTIGLSIRQGSEVFETTIHLGQSTNF